ncbi:Structural maintenance of chromosomes protein 1 [Morella rubra]|uniref:Structural maintenance of chromosomes protein 1 n=1 Tax=Morella rubra TaxID=262757 RepID=A0A6A1W3B0_9ROSI|nr:Structural maintenance of chromosomes protein 1 [Morella rubra]
MPAEPSPRQWVRHHLGTRRSSGALSPPVSQDETAPPRRLGPVVDAALVNLNVAKVAGFIRSKSCKGARGNQDPDGGSGFQSIVISLKDTFYDEVEALVGVYRNSERGGELRQAWLFLLEEELESPRV